MTDAARVAETMGLRSRVFMVEASIPTLRRPSVDHGSLVSASGAGEMSRTDRVGWKSSENPQKSRNGPQAGDPTLRDMNMRTRSIVLYSTLAVAVVGAGGLAYGTVNSSGGVVDQDRHPAGVSHDGNGVADGVGQRHGAAVDLPRPQLRRRRRPHLGESEGR